MEFTFNVVWLFGTALFIGVASGWIYKRLTKPRTEKRWPKDVVVVHDIGPGPHAPSFSPFPLKLQTFLRMAGIPYMVDFSSGFSSKGKIPWISVNDLNVADSQFSMDFIRDRFDVNLNNQLTTEQKAVARALRKMVEEELYWTMCSVTFGDDLSELERLLPYSGIKGFITPRLLRFFIWRQMKGHGIGRHTPSEILSIAHADLQALSDYLGQKAFFFGDDPSEGDCALFGVLAQIKWHMNTSPHQTWLKEEFSNLDAYCVRMKEKFWPDWLERTSDVNQTQTKIFGANPKGINVKLSWK